MNQVPLPDDWREQVYEAYTDALAQTGVAPDVVTLPFEWLRGYLQAPAWELGADIAFGFVERPVASIKRESLAKGFALFRSTA